MGVELEEMKSLGVIGVYREAYDIVLSRRRIFTQITLSLILPLSFISLAHTQLTNNRFPKITDQNQQDLAAETQIPTSPFTGILDSLPSKSASYWLLQAAYTLFSFVLSLLSTSALVYTMASVYSGQEEVTFRRVMSAVPKVWKRLMITSLSIFLAVCAYHVVAFVVIALVALLIVFYPNTNVGLVALLVVIVLYLMGFLYMVIVWQLASTISVLEDSYGFQAMKRSSQLIKGKVGLSIIIILELGLLYFLLQKALEKVVVHGESVGMVYRVAFGNVCLSLILILSLFDRVIQTIIYFVCKSHHNEKIDKLVLSDHLQAYTQEFYVPLKAASPIETAMCRINVV